VLCDVQLAPTFLELAGVPIPPEVDGHSIVPLLKGGGSREAVSGCETHDHCWHLGCILPRMPAIIVRTGRTSFLVEHYALADWPPGYQPGVTRINDCPANTYRALRVIEGDLHNLLYVEMTMVQDWWFADINFHGL